MSINFSSLQGLTIPEGNVTQITDASGRVLWSSTIKFTINGDTYIADRGMTWAEWFASSYNTTGETEGDIKDANGNEVSMDAVIIGGTAYAVGFSVPVTVSFAGSGGNSSYARAIIDGVTYYTGQEEAIEIPAGTTISLYFQDKTGNGKGSISHKKNGTSVYYSGSSSSASYNFDIEGNATITFKVGESYDDNNKLKKYGRVDVTEITET